MSEELNETFHRLEPVVVRIGDHLYDLMMRNIARI